MAEEREKKRKKAHASSTAPEPAPARSTQDMKAGELLRHVRTEKNMELEEVSAAIHVRVAQLRAIEEGHIESLPGMTYALGFVKSYATYLKLDPVSVANKFKSEHSVSPNKPDLKFPEPLSEHKMPDMFMIGAGVVAVVVLLGAWLFFSGGSEEKTNTNVATAIPAPPSDIAPLTAGAAPATPATVPGTETTGGSLVAQTPGTVPATSATVPAAATATAAAVTTPPAGPAVPPATAAKPAAATSPAVAAANARTAALRQKPAVAATAPVAAAAPAAQPEAAPLPAPQTETINIHPGRGRVMLQATQSTWVQVTDTAGNIVLKRVLRPGDRYYVPDQQGLSMVTSNAGGLSVYVDGRAARSIGNSGEIVRGVSLNPDALGGHHSTVHD